jgi:hypothetical protein
MEARSRYEIPDTPQAGICVAGGQEAPPKKKGAATSAAPWNTDFRF